MILRRIARPMLAAVFVSGGIETLRDPKPRIQAAEPVLDRAVGSVKDRIPEQLPTDTETLVKLDAALKVAAGLALAFGRWPRLAALVLAGSLVPTTLAGHRFWEHEDQQERAKHQLHLLKNTGLIGGLLIAAADTHGKPSLNWRARRATRLATARARHTTGAVQGTLAHAAGSARGVVRRNGHQADSALRAALHGARGAFTETVHGAGSGVRDTVREATGAARDAVREATGAAREAAHQASGAVRGTVQQTTGTARGRARALLR